MPFDIDNEGVRAGENLTMSNDQTTDKDFTQTDLNSGLCACVVSDNEEVGMGASGDKLFGKVVAVSLEMDATNTTTPKTVTVQADGAARFMYNTDVAPTVNCMVEVDGAGKVRKAAADADIAAGGHLMKGQVLSVRASDTTCLVWLG